MRRTLTWLSGATLTLAAALSCHYLTLSAIRWGPQGGQGEEELVVGFCLALAAGLSAGALVWTRAFPTGERRGRIAASLLAPFVTIAALLGAAMLLKLVYCPSFVGKGGVPCFHCASEADARRGKCGG